MKKATITIMAIFAFVLIAVSFKLAATQNQPPEPQQQNIGVLFLDHEAKTGYLNNRAYMARFETIEYPVAGEQDPQTVCRIDIWAYPSMEPVEYVAASFEKGAEFLKMLDEAGRPE